jgi:uncharacterized protein YerC
MGEQNSSNEIGSASEILLAKLLHSANSTEETQQILREVFSRQEINWASQRVLTVQYVLKGYTYRDISKMIGSSSYLIDRAKKTIVESETRCTVKFLQSLEEGDASE